MLNSINNLANMEMMLYGGLATNSKAPSYFNGYRGVNNYIQNQYNPLAQGTNWNYYNNYNTNPVFSPSSNNSTSQNFTSGNPANNNIDIKSSMDKLGEYYRKNEISPSQSFTSAVVAGGVSCAIMQNPRILAHPKNYFSTTFSKNSDVKNMFKAVKENGSTLNKTWKNNSYIMEEAYSQMHRAEARSKSKLGLFRKQYTADEYNKLKNIMQTALKTGDADKIAEATETLRTAYCRNGKVFQAWNWVTNLFRRDKKELINPISMIKSEAGKNEIKNKLEIPKMFKDNKITLKNAFKKTGGKIGILFGLTEIFLNWNKVTLAKEKDAENAKNGIQTNHGKTQTKQTIIKAIGNSVGWAAGETLGVWAFAKLGAKIGTAIGPGIGTAIGAVIGYVGGSLGMWLAGKATRAALKDDIADEIKVDNLKNTPEGQTELLSYTLKDIQAGKEVPIDTQQAVLNIYSLYQQQNQ